MCDPIRFVAVQFVDGFPVAVSQSLQSIGDFIARTKYQHAASHRNQIAELQNAKTYLGQSPSRKEFYEDLLWALLNNKQFLFVY